jgi:hydroxylaminobenzene mutase
MRTQLFELGLILFLIGLLTGFAVPALKNPRMALSSHLEAVLNGMFLVLLGLFWPHVDLPHGRWHRHRHRRDPRMNSLRETPL